MKNLKLLLFFLVFSPLFVQAQHKNQLIKNDTKNDITLNLGEEKIIFLKSKDSISIETEKVAYMMDLINSSDTAVIRRVGFVLLKGDIILVSKLKPMKTLMTNNGEREIAVEYYNYLVFIPPGETRELKGLVLGPEKSTTFVIKDFMDGKFTNPKVEDVHFQILNGVLATE